ncbi:MAG TPA: small multi-drug export protein [Kofleriaceae bacterium]|nr:small multi-drug export protein [Kofleriaceae bacterium]
MSKLIPPGSLAPAAGAPTPNPYDADWRERVIVLGTGSAIVLAGLVLGLVFANSATLELMTLVPLSMFAVGKFLPLWGLNPDSAFSPWALGLVIWAVDTATVLFIVYALEGLYRLKRLKRAIDKVQSNAGLVLTAYPRIRKGAVIGVMLFVLFPLAGTGAMMGAFMGILLGLHRRVTIMAVSAGGLIGGMVMAFLAVYFGEAIERLREAQEDPVVHYVIIGGLVVGMVALLWWLNRTYRRALTLAQDGPPEPNND